MINHTPLSERPTSAGACTCVSFGDLSISHGAQAPCGPPPEGAELLLPIGQELTVQLRQHDQLLSPKADLLYLPAQASEAHCSGFRGWRISLNPLRLSLLAAELSGHRLRPSRCLHHLSGARAIRAEDPRERGLGAALHQLLAQVAGAGPDARQLLGRAGLDVCIQRLIVLLLCSDLLAAPQDGVGASGRDRDQMFADLLAWIRANLHRPIRLEDLERQSCYSQRSLRNFFQEEFQCGPIQWIRHQRLEAARARLLRPVPGDTVSAIASEFGYLNLAQFSRDFQRTFQSRPSALLREGLRGRCDLDDSPVDGAARAGARQPASRVAAGTSSGFR